MSVDAVGIFQAAHSNERITGILVSDMFHSGDVEIDSIVLRLMCESASVNYLLSVLVIESAFAKTRFFHTYTHSHSNSLTSFSRRSAALTRNRRKTEKNEATP